MDWDVLDKFSLPPKLSANGTQKNSRSRSLYFNILFSSDFYNFFPVSK